jgi:hypothetical protein
MTRNYTKRPFLERLEDNTVRPDGPAGCWLWLGDTQDNGHGLISYGGKTSTVHRHVWQYYNGTLPKGVVVRHKCDVRPCWNPDHLEPGTIQDNSDDMTSRSRQARGAKQGAAKLTDEIVAAIRTAHAAGEFQKDLAVKYGVSASTISNIIKRLSWVHVQ